MPCQERRGQEDLSTAEICLHVETGSVEQRNLDERVHPFPSHYPSNHSKVLTAGDQTHHEQGGREGTSSPFAMALLCRDENSSTSLSVFELVTGTSHGIEIDFLLTTENYLSSAQQAVQSWQGREDSNPQPADLESAALPIGATALLSSPHPLPRHPQTTIWSAILSAATADGPCCGRRDAALPF